MLRERNRQVIESKIQIHEREIWQDREDKAARERDRGREQTR